MHSKHFGIVASHTEYCQCRTLVGLEFDGSNHIEKSTGSKKTKEQILPLFDVSHQHTVHHHLTETLTETQKDSMKNTLNSKTLDETQKNSMKPKTSIKTKYTN